jgi:hypothetical protein
MGSDSVLEDTETRCAVYEATVANGMPPTIARLEAVLQRSTTAVRESLERLALAKALVLQAESREILMAEPFSAVPTPFTVTVEGRLYFGNCIWDALGIPAMLSSDAQIRTSCGCCSEAMSLSVEAGALRAPRGVIHFAVPAIQWWDDIVFT